MKYIVLFLSLFVSLGVLSAPPDNLYHYRAKVISVYDGDTVRANIDLGLDTWTHNQPLRLSGLDAPELRGETREAGLAARAYLTSLIGTNPIIVETVKDDREKYGRLLVTIWVNGSGGWCPSGTWCSANYQMITSGHAVAREY